MPFVSIPEKSVYTKVIKPVPSIQPKRTTLPVIRPRPTKIAFVPN